MLSRSFTTLGLLAFGTIPATRAYTLQTTYNAGNWMSQFTVEAIADPTDGFVTYLDQGDAEAQGLYSITNNQVYIGVDHTNTYNPNGAGRNSVRLQSNQAYTHGLVIADFAYIPGNDCGSWPAFWMVGPNWPNDGEIDIIEGVNLNSYDTITLHTAAGCTPSVGSGGQSGTSTNPNTDCGAGGGYNGCSVQNNNPVGYGTPFDANGGGVYAMLWESSGIQIWNFARSAIPGDITSGNPNPSGWGTPVANFAGCNFDQYFQDMNIVFDTDFCGQWAGAVWGSSSCASINPSCNAYVASEPQSFGNLYWLVNSIKVYQ